MFNQIIIWGHKLHSHTHSYIHFAFYKTFKYLGYNCLWLDNNDDISQINFTKSLFITEGQVDQDIPLLDDSIYILHNCSSLKYQNITNKINLQVITKSDLDRYTFIKCPNEYGFYTDNMIMMCWGTDLLPDEINKNIDLVKDDKLEITKNLNFVGMSIYPWDEVKLWCENNGYHYSNYGGFNNNVTCEKNMELIQKSILAPAFQEKWQVENGYIPCRIFKNISYGKMGITNNSFVNEIFDNKLIYGEDIHKTLDLALANNDKDTLISLMEEVRDKHTYINRVNFILWFLNNVFKYQ